MNYIMMFALLLVIFSCIWFFYLNQQEDKTAAPDADSQNSSPVPLQTRQRTSKREVKRLRGVERREMRC